MTWKQAASHKPQNEANKNCVNGMNGLESVGGRGGGKWTTVYQQWKKGAPGKYFLLHIRIHIAWLGSIFGQSSVETEKEVCGRRAWRLTPPVCFGWLMEVTYVYALEKKKNKKYTKLCSHLGRGIRRFLPGTPCLLIFKCNEPFPTSPHAPCQQFQAWVRSKGAALHSIWEGKERCPKNTTTGATKQHLRNPLAMF